MIEIIAFDADDTLWHNETWYSRGKQVLQRLVSRYNQDGAVDSFLDETEERNIAYYGYGIKSFTLSMVESAIQLSQGKIRGSEIQELLDHAKQMLTAKVELFDHVEKTLEELVGNYRLMLITKGDLVEQERKIARSGLQAYFRHIEIVSGKSEESYQGLLHRHHLEAGQFLMVGNSLRSDILPVLRIGGWAVHVPYDLTWGHENLPAEQVAGERYFEIDCLDQLPGLVRKLSE